MQKTLNTKVQRLLDEVRLTLPDHLPTLRDLIHQRQREMESRAVQGIVTETSQRPGMPCSSAAALSGISPEIDAIAQEIDGMRSVHNPMSPDDWQMLKDQQPSFYRDLLHAHARWWDALNRAAEERGYQACDSVLGYMSRQTGLSEVELSEDLET